MWEFNLLVSISSGGVSFFACPTICGHSSIYISIYLYYLDSRRRQRVLIALVEKQMFN